MKQIIPFVKDISLAPKIYEVTSIALEHNLKMENSDSVVGSFTVSGKYRINNISINEEVFEENIPFDITLDSKYDASKVIIDIDDFYYEIINDEFLRVHIDVLVDNLVYEKKEVEKPKEIIKEEREEISTIINERNDDLMNDNVNLSDKKEDTLIREEDVKASKKDEERESDITNKIETGLFDKEEKYITYKVHIVRDTETIDEITAKYNVSKEELEKYNDLNNIVLGTKIIIPISNEQ
ncbi:MAG: LysM peptidoglycan-binding domain-containing protein [Lachnospiraceae bacterium]